MRFDEFVEAALYGPDGFYSGSGRAGRRGDFLTSPEVGPLFGAVLARAIDDCWIGLGSPDRFQLVEVGAGPGTLARTIRAARPEVLTSGALEHITVERSAAQRGSHPDGVDARETFPDGPITGMILANELLDNLAFRLLVFDGRWCEAHVARDGDRLVERLVPWTGPLPGFLPGRVAHGARVPLQQQAGDWLRDALGRLAAGRVVLFDYVTPRTAELAVRPWRDWLRTYRGHQRGGHYLTDPGEQDITTQVCLDQLIAAAGEPDSYRSQAQYLQRWGIDELVADGRRRWEADAARPGLAAIAGRSRTVEAEALLDRDGLGSFSALEWVR